MVMGDPDGSFADPHGAAGHRDRMRRKLLDAGPAAILDHELLEMVLFLALPRRDTKPLARALLAEPDLINRIAADGTGVRSVCDHCNQCMPTIYSRTRCVVTGAPDSL